MLKYGVRSHDNLILRSDRWNSGGRHAEAELASMEKVGHCSTVLKCGRCFSFLPILDSVPVPILIRLVDCLSLGHLRSACRRQILARDADAQDPVDQEGHSAGLPEVRKVTSFKEGLTSG